MFRQESFYPALMYISIFTTGAMSYIHTKLEHTESVLHKFFAETGSCLSLLLAFSRQVIHNKCPHYTIGVKAFSFYFHISGYTNFLCSPMKHLTRLTAVRCV